MVIRYVMLPRPSFLRVRNILDSKNEYGRYNLEFYDNAPVYIRPTMWERLAPKAWIFWMLGKPLPGDQKRRFHPKGYRIEEVGPKRMAGLGLDEMDGTRLRLSSQDCGGCPFSL